MIIRQVVIVPTEGINPEIRMVYEEWEASPKAQHIHFWTSEKFMRTLK